MIPDPLHPAVVHLPIALAILIPGLALVWIFLIQKKFLPARTWAVVVLLQGILLGSGWIALETGEDQEDAVERVVAERYIEDHEEAAERFLLIAGIALAAMATGLLPSRAGSIGRALGTLATFAVLAAGADAGHSGGELVYKHGAASVYVDAPDTAGSKRTAHDDD